MSSTFVPQRFYAIFNSREEMLDFNRWDACDDQFGFRNGLKNFEHAAQSFALPFASDETEDGCGYNWGWVFNGCHSGRDVRGEFVGLLWVYAQKLFPH